MFKISFVNTYNINKVLSFPLILTGAYNVTCTIIVDTKFDLLVKIMFVKFLPYKATFFPFVINAK